MTELNGEIDSFAIIFEDVSVVLSVIGRPRREKTDRKGRTRTTEGPWPGRRTERRHASNSGDPAVRV